MAAAGNQHRVATQTGEKKVATLVSNNVTYRYGYTVYT
jgi:hypothetical protein